MDKVNILDKIDFVLSEFNKVEELKFINNLKELYYQDKNILINRLKNLLLDEKLNIHLKYLIIRFINDVNEVGYFDTLKELLFREDKIMIINEILQYFVNQNSLKSFKTIKQYKKTDMARDNILKINGFLNAMYSKNPLIYHFDVLLSQKRVKKLEVSTNYLISNIKKGELDELVYVLNELDKEYAIEVLKILVHYPDKVYYKFILQYAESNIYSANYDDFKIIAKALINSGMRIKSKNDVFKMLKEILLKLDDKKLIYFAILMLKINTKAMIKTIIKFYGKLTIEEKLLFLDSLDLKEKDSYMNFLKDLVIKENNKDLIKRLIYVFVKNNEINFLFENLSLMSNVKRNQIVSSIIEEGIVGLDEYMIKILNTDLEDNLLKLIVQYLIKYSPNKYIKKFIELFFSGIGIEIKEIIIKNIPNLNSKNLNEFVKKLNENVECLLNFKKYYLISILKVLKDNKLDENYHNELIRNILILLEESEVDEIVDFIYFFDNYDIKDRKLAKLIIDEFRMIENTLLISSNDNELVRMIYVLIRKIRKKFPQLHNSN